MTPGVSPQINQQVLGGQQLTPPDAPAPLTGWAAQAAHLPADIPDSGYDAIREKYFYEHMAQPVLQQGASLSMAKDHFMAATARQKSEHPRLMTTATAAGQALTAPISGMSPYDSQIQAIQGHINEQAAGAAQEATKQGIWAAPYQMAGQLAGTAPYFAEGLMGPEAMGEQAALRALPNAGRVMTEGGREVLTKEAADALAIYNQSVIHKATVAGAVGAIQGAYDAASAPEGQRLAAGIQGAATGAAFATGIEVVGGLTAFLRARHGVSTPTAEAVANVAKGVGTPSEEALATSAVVEKGSIADTVGEFVGQTKRKQAAQGQPSAVLVAKSPNSPAGAAVPTSTAAPGITLDTPTTEAALPPQQAASNRSLAARNRQYNISLLGADGKPYTLKARAAEFESLAPQLVDHLNAGGQIESINGNPKVVNSILKTIANKNPDAFKLESPIKAASPDAAPVMPATIPQTNIITDPDIYRPPQMVQTWLQQQHAAGKDYSPWAIRQKFGMGDAGAQKAYDWWVDALDQREAKRRLPNQTTAISRDTWWPAGSQNASWISPSGEIHNLEGGQHFEIPEAFYGKSVDQFIYEENWARQRGNGLEVSSLKAPQLVHGVMEAAKYGDSVAIDYGPKLSNHVDVPREAISEFLANPQKYINQQGSARFAVDSSYIPDYDRYVQLPSGELLNKETGEIHDFTAVPKTEPEPTEEPVYGIVRGSADVPLSLHGHDQVDALGQRIAAKGGLDTLHMADLTRYRQTAEGILRHDRTVVPQLPNPDLRSWGLGGLEGQDHTPSVSRQINYMIDNPNTYTPGQGRLSTSAPESLNQFKARVLSKINEQMLELEKNPNKKIGWLTSSRDIGLVKAWLDQRDANPNSLNIDPNAFKTAQENPGGVYRVAPNEFGRWSIRQVDMDNDQELRGGLYMIRHGETPWNKAARQMEMQDKPLGRYGVGSSPFLQDSAGVTIQYPGSTNSTILLRDVTDRGTLFHENLHGHFGALGLHSDVMNIMDDPTTEQIYNAGFAPAARDLYGDDPYIYREEVYAHGADAIRTGNNAKIDAFADADTDRETWLSWMAGKTDELLGRVAMKDDSLHKRVAERRLNAVQSRATNSLADIHNTYSQGQGELDFAHGQYSIKDGDVTTLYPSREEALHALEGDGEEPLNSPELVPIDKLPEGVARYSRAVRPMRDGERPSLTDPPKPAMIQAKGGLQMFSRFFRPFNDWLATVSQKNAWPELYQAFSPLDNAQVNYNNLVRPHFDTLQATLGKWTERRQQDAMKWFKNPGSDFVQEELRFTPKELADLQTVKEQVLNPLAQEFGTSLEHYVDHTLPQVAVNGGDVDKAFPQTGNQTKSNFMIERLRRRSLDPNEKNFAKLVAKYLEFGGFDKHVGPAIDQAEAVVRQTLDGKPATKYTPYQDMKAGPLYPLLQRHIDYLRGQPDFTQEILKGALEGGIDLVNQGLDKLNQTVGTKFEPITKLDDDPLGKYTLFMYAGALAMKPATIVRDGLQLLMTTLPIAGKYTARGIAKAFSGKTAEETAALWDTAAKYGALIERNDLRSLYTGVDEAPGSAATSMATRLERGAEKAANFGMRSIQLTHNGNRLAAFWGHTEQVADALDEFRASGDEKRFTRDSGLWFMNKSQREAMLNEIPSLKSAADIKDFTHRAAKELTELSQWNFKKGANPGLYEYQLGRLFGQYGTWPLNYIEYARRLATADDGLAARNALTRLVLTHGAILAAGQSMGVDTGRWTFTGPMAYEGGPWLEALQALPKVGSAFESSTEGQEFRRGVGGVIPGVDRAIDTYDIFQAASSDNMGEFWKRVLGFHMLNSEDYQHGLHQFLPNPNKE